MRQLAAEYAWQGRYPEAISLLEQLANRAPSNHAVWFSLGNLYLCCDRVADAEKSYSMAIALRPRFGLAYTCRGIARLSSKNYRAAQADFDQTLQLNPESYPALVNRAIVKQELEDLEGALHDLNSAIKIRGEYDAPDLLRSRLRARMGQLAGARADRRIALRTTPQDEPGWVARGVARLREDPEAALADFVQALELNPHSRTALQNIAHVRSEQLGDVQGALMRRATHRARAS